MSKPTPGFPGLTCPKCDEPDTLALCLEGLDTLACTSCQDETLIEGLRERIAAYSAFLAWFDRAMTRPVPVGPMPRITTANPSA